MGAAGYLGACMLMWGMATFTMNVAGRHLDPMTIAAFNMFGYLAVGAFLFPYASWSFTKYHAMGIAIGAMFVLGNMAFYKLSQTGQVSTLVPLTALYVALPVVLGILALGEALTLRKVLGVLLAIGAIYLLSAAEEPA